MQGPEVVEQVIWFQAGGQDHRRIHPVVQRIQTYRRNHLDISQFSSSG